MTKPYLVRFTGDSALKLDAARTFTGPGYRVRVADALEKQDPSPESEHVGLLYTVELEAESIIAAIRQAAAIVSPICDLLATAHGTALDDPFLLFAIDLDPSSDDRELAQVIRDTPELRKVRRAFTDSLFRPLHTLLEAARAKDASRAESERLGSRLDRALHYLRRSYLESDPLDRFEDLAAALQAIDTRIRRKHALLTTFPRRCEHCREPLHCRNCSTTAMRSDNWPGTDYVITEILKRPEEDARRLRDKRNDVAHSLKELPDLLSAIDKLTALAHDAVLAGVLDLLDAPESYRAALLRKPLSLLSRPEFLVTATVHHSPIDQIRRRRRYPLLKLIAVETLVPTQTDPATRPPRVVGVTLNLQAETFDEDWTPGVAYSRVAKDPEDASPDPDVVVQKLLRGLNSFEVQYENLCRVA